MLGAARLLLCPIDGTAGSIEGSFSACLPASIPWDGPKQLDRERTTLKQAYPIDVARIE